MIAAFDTNIFLAAIITEGTCSKLLHTARAGEFSLISCPFILTEIRRILTRKFRLSHAEIASAMEPVSEATAQIIEHHIKITGICRDADGDNVIACAVAAKADYPVTGDADLLAIKSYRGVRFITPRDFEASFFIAGALLASELWHFCAFSTFALIAVTDKKDGNSKMKWGYVAAVSAMMS